MFSYKRKRHFKKKTYKKKTYKKKTFIKKTFKKKDIKKKNFKGGTIGALDVKKALDDLDVTAIDKFYRLRGEDMMRGVIIHELNDRRETLANYFSNMRKNLTTSDEIDKWNSINFIIKPK